MEMWWFFIASVLLPGFPTYAFKTPWQFYPYAGEPNGFNDNSFWPNYSTPPYMKQLLFDNGHKKIADLIPWDQEGLVSYRIGGGDEFSPKKWPNAMHAILDAFQAVRQSCYCNHFDCGCCVGLSIKPLGFKKNICANLTVATKDLFKTTFDVTLYLKLGHATLFEISATETQPVIACMNLYPFYSLQSCLAVSDFFYDQQEGKTCLCTDIFARRRGHGSMIGLPRECTCLGRIVPFEEEHGIFETLASALKAFSQKIPLIG